MIFIGAILLAPQAALAGVTLVSGNGQIVLEQFLANQPMVIQATDASGNPAAGVAVTWSLTPQIGTITHNSSASTDANGMAQAIFLGSTIQPGFSFQAATITGTTPLGSVSFIVTVVPNHTQSGGLAPPPTAVLIAPPPDNRQVSGRAGSTLPGAVVVQVIAQAGFQLGAPIPNIGVRIGVPQTDPNSTTPPLPSTAASCQGPAGLVLTDAMGMAHCDLVLGTTPGTYGVTAVTGEIQNTALFGVQITPGPACLYTLTPTTQTVVVGGGTGTIGVNTSAGCGWTAQSNAPWITFTSAASGIGNGSVSISIAANSLPDPRTGTLTIAGQTYTVNQNGTSGAAALAITTPAALPSANLNAGYSVILAAVGGTPPYTWASTGSLPAGISLNSSTGVLNGAPTAAGVFNFNVTVSDSAAVTASASQTFSLSVSGGGGGGAFSITTASVAPGVVGTPYQQTLTTMGGCPPNPFAQTTFAITAGSLPAGLGLALTGQGVFAIKGTPTVAGTSNFTVTATEPCGTNASASFSLTVTATAPAGPNLGAAPAALTFNVQTGSTTSPANQPINITSSGAALNFTAVGSTSSGGNWLTVSAANGTTPATLNIGVSNFSSLAPGTYNGSIVIASAQAANSPLTIAVTLIVGGTISLNASPASFTFNYTIGANTPSGQTLNITSSGASIGFTTAASTSSGGNWITVSAANGTTPAALTIGVANLSNLAPGTYNGSVVITSPQALNSPVTIPVTLNVGAITTVNLSPQSLTFNFTIGSKSVPGPQTIQVTSNGSVAHLGISSNTFIAPNWLSVTPQIGDTPATLTVSVTTGGLAAGMYSGLVLISVQGSSPSTQTVPVTLNILPPPTATANPLTLSFNVTAGSQAPAPQTVAVTSSVPLGINVASVTTSGGNWLTFSPSSGTTPTSISVGANPGSLGPGTYMGTVTISSADSGLPLVAIAVTLTVTPGPPVVLSITNAASFIPGAIAPGEIVTLFGNGMGPANLVVTAITNGFLGNSTAGTRVLFDGNPAALLYVSGKVVSAIVPYEIAGRDTVNLQVEVQGILSSPLSLRVADSAAGIFTLDATGQGAILNQDTSVNSLANPAIEGTVISIYATGEGATNPTGVDGKVALDFKNLPKPKLPVTVTIGGLDATVTYAGAAPGLPAGVLQVNAKVPIGLSTNARQAVVIKVNGAPGQDGVFVATRPQP